MIQYRHDAARQLMPAPISYPENTIPRRRGPGRRPGPIVAYPALLRQIESALFIHEITATRFGINAARDPRLVHDLRMGRRVTTHVRDTVLAYLASLDGEA